MIDSPGFFLRILIQLPTLFSSSKCLVHAHVSSSSSYLPCGGCICTRSNDLLHVSGAQDSNCMLVACVDQALAAGPSTLLASAPMTEHLGIASIVPLTAVCVQVLAVSEPLNSTELEVLSIDLGSTSKAGVADDVPRLLSLVLS